MNPRAVPDSDPGAGTVRGIWFRLLRVPLLGLARLVVGLRIDGIERIPRDGGLLVVANHLHNADPVIMAIGFPRPVHFMAKQELFRYRPIGWLLRKFGNFPIARGRSDRVAIRRAISAQRHGIAVGMFPEGTRSRTMAMSTAHPGVGFVAMQGTRLILPVGITGSERLPFNGSRPEHLMPDPRHRGVRLRIGEAFTLPETGVDGRKLSAEAATDTIMRSIAALLPDAYRGAYASSGATSSSSSNGSSEGDATS